MDLTHSKVSNSNHIMLLLSVQIYIYIYIYIYKWVGWAKLLVYFIWVWATFLFGRKKSFRPKFQSHLITIYVCLIAYRMRLVVEGIVI